MKQSRPMSLLETVGNVAVGYVLAVVTQVLAFPAFGIQATIAENLKLRRIFTVVSIARSYALRRLFEEIRVRQPWSGQKKGHAEARPKSREETPEGRV
jgi:hypothetical protein